MKNNIDSLGYLIKLILGLIVLSIFLIPNQITVLSSNGHQSVFYLLPWLFIRSDSTFGTDEVIITQNLSVFYLFYYLPLYYIVIISIQQLRDFDIYGPHVVPDQYKKFVGGASLMLFFQFMLIKLFEISQDFASTESISSIYWGLITQASLVMVLFIFFFVDKFLQAKSNTLITNTDNITS